MGGIVNKLFLIFATLSFCQLGFTGDQLAQKVKFYYGKSLSANKNVIKSKIHRILNSQHLSRDNNFDQIVEACDEFENEHCYSHVRFGYKAARKYLFGQLHLEGSKKSNYHLTTYYCLDEVDNDMLPKKKGLGPDQIPHSQILNAEHSWPQSHFTTEFSKSLQKSDLHALFPVRMKVNSTRGNYPYGEVDKINSLPCKRAALGLNTKNKIVFEPADEVKGDIARASFYFSVRYKIIIDGQQEAILRKWHKQDPVDRYERQRNSEIFEIQHVRNPFIDHPEWVKMIHNF